MRYIAFATYSFLIILKVIVAMAYTGTEFDLDAAYSRYAFVKELERHKEEQKRYEQILRGEDVEEDTNQHVFDGVVESDVSSDADEEL